MRAHPDQIFCASAKAGKGWIGQVGGGGPGVRMKGRLPRPRRSPGVRVGEGKEAAMYKQVLDPVNHSLGETSLFAVLPLLVLLFLAAG